MQAAKDFYGTLLPKGLGANDSDFERGLAEEIKILESLRNSITGDSGVADNWRKDLDDDVALWKKMLYGEQSR